MIILAINLISKQRKSFEKVKRTIKSCKTFDQLMVATSLTYYYFLKYNDIKELKTLMLLVNETANQFK